MAFILNKWTNSLIVFVICVTILLFLVTYSYVNARKLEIQDDDVSSQVDNRFDGSIPRVYNAIYTRRDANDTDCWLFNKKYKDNASLIEDIIQGRINYVFAGGRLYQVKHESLDGEFHKIRFSDRCLDKKDLPFQRCTTSSIPISPFDVSLHVLGYRI